MFFVLILQFSLSYNYIDESVKEGRMQHSHGVEFLRVRRKSLERDARKAHDLPIHENFFLESASRPERPRGN